MAKKKGGEAIVSANKIEDLHRRVIALEESIDKLNKELR